MGAPAMSAGSILRATLADFAAMLRVSPDAAEDAILSERGAKAVLSRRSVFLAASALATGLVVSAPAPLATPLIYSGPAKWQIHVRDRGRNINFETIGGAGMVMAVAALIGTDLIHVPRGQRAP